MGRTPQDNATQQRRRLLKGALGASTVVTLGYGGNVAAASISCVAKVRDLVTGGPPGGTNQFTMVKPTDQGGANWGWVKVDVRKYKLASGGAFEAFEVNGQLFKTAEPDVPVTGASLTSKQKGYPKDGWVLAYFDDDGNLAGTYPTEQLGKYGATPAAASCLTSVNPGAVSNLTFGG